MEELYLKKHGDPLKAEDWNHIVQLLQKLGNLTAAQPLQLSNAPNGMALSIKLPRDVVVVKGTSNATGGGKYNGRILRGLSDANDSDDLDMPEGLDVPSADDCLLLNPSEDGGSTHQLSAPFFCVGFRVGSLSDGKPIVLIASSGGGAGLIPVKLTVSSGSTGSSATAISFKYTAKYLDDTAVKNSDGSTATELVPQYRFIHYGNVAAGSHGVLYFDESGNAVLWQADEVWGKIACGT